METGAIFDSTERYRYRLWRIWNRHVPTITFIMLNPSRADHRVNDPTVRRCLNFAQTWSCGGLEVVNLFAYRTAYPQQLKQANDPIGIDNDHHLKQVFEQSAQVILAWGNQGTWLNRNQAVLDLIRPQYQPYCLGFTKQGQPRHPLYAKRDLTPIRFDR
ncbi:MAG: DUF1643 domain-containing protein [Microcoleaceae cyanobacterium]